MKKRFVAKQIGALSLAAILSGMPAVNVLAEDVYQEKVEEAQSEAEKAFLKAALNVTFETEFGETVGSAYVESNVLWPWDSYTFRLGTDYNLPEGWELVGAAEDKTVKCGETASLKVIVKPVAAETVTTKATISFKTIYGEEVGTTEASTNSVGGEGEYYTFMLGTDYNLPEGWQLASGIDQDTNLEVQFGQTSPYELKVEPISGEVVETKLNVTFETKDGQKVGETTATTNNVGGEGESWTFMLGTDFNLPEGYKLAEGVDQITNIQVPFGNVAGHTMIVEPIAGEVVETKLNVTFETKDGEKVGETTATTNNVGGEGELWTFMLGTDFNLPEGYKLAEGVDQITNIQVPFGHVAGHTMIVEKVEEEAKATTLTVTFETIYGEKVGTTTATTNNVGGEGESWTFMLGTDFNLPEGWQLATGVDQITNIQVPFGSVAGHTMIVEPIPGEVVETKLNVTFETKDGEKVGETTATTNNVGGEGESWTFMLGTDFNLPEGYKLAEGVDQITNIQVPFGHVAGHTMIVEKVEEEAKATTLTVTFETIYGEKVGTTTATTNNVGGEGESWTFMLGTDFNLPEGWQLAIGVDQITNIQVPFGSVAGHTMIVEPIPGEVVETKLNVTFETKDGEKVGETTATTNNVGGEGESWTFMLGTDFNLPEGYKLAEGVDQITNIQVPFGSVAGHTMIVEKIAEDKSSIVKVQFVSGDEVVAGGDYFVDADGDGIFNHSELEQWVPEGYKLAEFGDFQVSEYKDTALQLTVEKENKSSIVKVQFVDADTNEVMGGGDYFVDGDGDGIFTDREVVEYVPGGYELAEFGDFQVSEYTETPLQLSVVKTQKSSIVKVQFVDSITNEVMGGGDYFVDADGDGIFNHSELEEWVPEGYKLAEFGDFQVSEYKDTALQLTVEKENKSSIVKVQFVDADTNEVMGGGDYFVDGDGDGIFTHREVVEYVPEGYKLAEFGDFQVSEYTETPLQLSVVKVEKSSIVKVQFVDADTDEVIAGGDYFVDEDGDGIFNHSELVEWVPEGYELAEFGDFQVSEYKETPLQLSVVKKAEEKPEIPWIDLEPSTPVKPEIPWIDLEPSTPVKPEIPWTDLEPSTPVKPETPWTDLEPSTQVDSETPGKDDTNKDDGKTENTDKKTENKSKTPKTGDDLQAAGTFSILGAGALAAIAALLKKRK